MSEQIISQVMKACKTCQNIYLLKKEKKKKKNKKTKCLRNFNTFAVIETQPKGQVRSSLRTTQKNNYIPKETIG